MNISVILYIYPSFIAGWKVTNLGVADLEGFNLCISLIYGPGEGNLGAGLCDMRCGAMFCEFMDDCDCTDDCETVELGRGCGDMDVSNCGPSSDGYY